MQKKKKSGFFKVSLSHLIIAYVLAVHGYFNHRIDSKNVQVCECPEII